MTNSEILEAVKCCTVYGKCTDCPYYSEGDCDTQLLKDLAKALEGKEESPKQELNHDWDEVAKPVATCRVNFVERDLIIDEIEEAKDIADANEKDWCALCDYFQTRCDSLKDKQCDEIREAIRKDGDMAGLAVKHADEWDYLTNEILSAKSDYQALAKKCTNDIAKAKAKLRDWDDCHDMTTGEKINDKVQEFVEKAKESEHTYKPKTEENYWEGFGKMLKEFPGNLAKEEVEAAQKIKTFDDVIEWLFTDNTKR